MYGINETFNNCVEMSPSERKSKMYVERYKAHSQILSAPETHEHLQSQYQDYRIAAPSMMGSHTGTGKGPELASFEQFAANRKQLRAEAVQELKELIKTASDPFSIKCNDGDEYDQSSLLEIQLNYSGHYRTCLGRDESWRFNNHNLNGTQPATVKNETDLTLR